MIKIINMTNKTVLKLFICILTAIFTSCNKSGYKKIDGKMYYYTWNYQSGDHKREVKDADLATFTVNKEHNEYASDKNHIYVWGNVIETDASTFKIIKSKGFYAT
ncbi:MAG: DKNYY domain-containing protein, partial [Prevotellaceae bacterium]|nr:DKNYY domain-containing protein [Prevotellaceae bacterium]